MVKINLENAEERIRQDYFLVAQVDTLVAKYSEKLGLNNKTETGRIVLDNEEQLDITGLLSLKNTLIRDIERKRLEIQGQKEPVRIINFGKPQQVQKSFFGKTLVLIPMVFLGLFLLFDFFKFLNRRSKEMQLQ